MARHKIGVIIPLSLRERILADKDFNRLFKLGEVVATDLRDAISLQQACELLADCTIALGSWRTPYPNAEIVKARPKLRLWEHAVLNETFQGPSIVATCSVTGKFFAPSASAVLAAAWARNTTK